MAFSGFYHGRRVLVTGHTGFKGAWLSLWLRQLGAEVHGLALPPEGETNLYSIIRDDTFHSEHPTDIREFESLKAAVAEVQPQLILHLAAQAIVQTSYRDPLATFYSNAVGTAHLLEAVHQLALPCDVLVVTSDKCYENREWEHPYRETDALGGHDVYSMSKAVTELVAQSWSRSFFRDQPSLGRIVTARAGNVIGGGDFAENRIVPDAARALARGEPVPVRNPAALRPWQHVLDCLSGYLLLASRIAHEPKDSPLVSPFNFGPVPEDVRTVQDVVEELLRHWPGRWESIGTVFAGKEAGRLQLAIEKAETLLGWRPVWPFAEAIRQTARWYHAHAEGRDSAELRALSTEQIASFETAARARSIPWASPS